MYSVTLANGLVLEFVDHSNRYFGDYWRVRIEARCRVPLSAAFSDPADPELAQARALLGDEVAYTRSLERMGVPSAEVDAAIRSLIDSFLSSTFAYLGDLSFAARFVRQKLAECRKGFRPFLCPR